MDSKRFAKQHKKARTRIVVLLSVLAVIVASVVVFAVANRPKDVLILDGTTSLKVTTNEKDAQTIIEQNGFTLGKYDVLDASQFEKENAVLIIKRELSVVFCENGGEAWRVTLPARTVADVLEYLNITPGEEDVVEPAAFEIVEPGSKITLYRAGTATLTVAGVSTSVTTSNKTVKQILAENHIVLGKEDKVSPRADSVVCDGEEIVLTRVLTKTVKEKEPVRFKTVRQGDSTLPAGEEKVFREGKDGEKEVLYKVRYENGKEVSRKKVSETVLAQPQDKVVLVGSAASGNSAGSAEKTVSGAPKHYKAKYTGIASAYYEPAGNLTASGMQVGYGRIGVNPSIIPYGTKLYVTGYGYCVAADTGWGTTGMGRLADLYFPSEAACEAWGLRTVTMYVLD